jgi:uncharacterized protein (TIGR01777 family)
MKIFLTGGTGFVGKGLTKELVQSGHEVTLLTRSLRRFGSKPPAVSLIEGDPTQKGEWQDSVGGHDIIINLAGASIFARWTKERKQNLRESRILTTRNIVDALAGGTTKTFFSTSAIGYYGFHEDEELTEASLPGDDFLAQLALDWEKEALRAQGLGIRVVLTRFGIVLGEDGGALGQMVPMFKKYIGGPLGSGKQWFSWIHLEDLVQAFLFLVNHPEISGAVNLTAPNPVRNKDLAAALGKILNRPAFMPAPEFILRLVLGEFGSILLKGQKVLPQRLLQSGFRFCYPTIDKALKSIVESGK